MIGIANRLPTRSGANAIPTSYLNYHHQLCHFHLKREVNIKGLFLKRLPLDTIHILAKFIHIPKQQLILDIICKHDCLRNRHDESCWKHDWLDYKHMERSTSSCQKNCKGRTSLRQRELQLPSFGPIYLRSIGFWNQERPHHYNPYEDSINPERPLPRRALDGVADHYLNLSVHARWKKRQPSSILGPIIVAHTVNMP